MSEEHLDEDPFAEDEKVEEENYISEGMVKKVTYLIHKLANQRKQDFKEIQKKCKKLFAYTNLAKVTLEDGHKIIDKLIELTGGEEQSPQQGARVTDDGSEPQKTTKEPAERRKTTELEELEAEIGKLAVMLQLCVGNSREIVSEEMGEENITEGTRAILVKSFAATLFIEASKRGLGR